MGFKKNKFERYSIESVQFYNHKVPDLLEQILFKKEYSALLDMGCGDGSMLFSLKNKKLLRNIKRVAGIDLSTIRLKRLNNCLPEIETYKGDVTNLPTIKGGFDIVISSQVVEHVSSDERMMKEISKMLITGGTLFISSVVKRKYGWWIYKCNGKVTCDPTHVREYSSKEEFIGLISKYGYDVQNVQLSFFRPSVVNAIIRILIKKNLVSEEFALIIARTAFFKFLNTLLKIPVIGYYIIEVEAVKIIEYDQLST